MGMWVVIAIGTDDAVVEEIIVRNIVRIVIAAIGIDLHPIVVEFAQSLIHKIPDKTTLVFGILANQIPILLESTHGVPHGMGILALNQRLLGITLAVVFRTFVIAVHRAINIGKPILTGLFVLNRTALILFFDPGVAVLEIGAVTGLIAQRPSNDGGMVVPSLHIALVALQVCQGKGWIFGKRLVAIPHPMRFHIGLSYHIQAILVAQVVPIVVVGIVASAHSIDVQLFHPLHILLHAVTRNHIPPIGIHLVAVGAFNQHRLAIHQELSIFNLHLAETDLHRNHLQHPVVLFRDSLQRVKHWRFGTPFGRIGHIKNNVLLARTRKILSHHNLLLRIEQLKLHIHFAFQHQLHR